MALNGSKFFTWTKGDRKNVSHGMVQIPVECITIKDMGYGRSTKASRRTGRKPLPLSFADSKPDYNGAQTHESSTLHEAAVRSATSLLAAMSDVLKSPQFISNQSSDHLLPVYGRPRSRTAPPTPATPLVEAPPTDPVELPASETTWQDASASWSKPVIGRGVHSSSTHTEPARCHSRTRSSTDQVSLREMGRTARASSGLSETTSTRPSIDSSLRNDSEYNVRRTANRSQDSLSGLEMATASSTPERCTLRTSHELRKLSNTQDRVVGPHADEQVASSEALQSTRGVDALGATTEIMARVLDLRKTHESHIIALKQVHGRELAASSAYIALLESQRPSAQSTTSSLSQVANSDTPSAYGSRTEFDLSYSRTDSAHSVETMAQKEDAIDAGASVQTELYNLRRERDYFKSLSHQASESNAALEETLAHAKNNEAALDNFRSALEASVAAANMQRVDALAALDHAQKDLRATRQREDLLRSELDELRQRFTEDESKHSSTVNKIDSKSVGTATSPVGRPDMRSSRSSKVGVRTNPSCVVADQMSSTSATDADSLRAQLLLCQTQLQEAKSDRERYNVLLHSELRRQSKLATIQAHTNSPEVQHRASVAMASRQSRGSSAFAGKTHCNVNASEPCASERELRYCFEEIIMYKLDVKGYKKDLKSAYARIASLEGSVRQQTPERKALSNSKPDHDYAPPSDPSLGLGIITSLDQACPTPPTSKPAVTSPPPATPSRTQATPLPLTSPTRVDHHQPLSIHKALPDPPPLNPSSPKPSTYQNTQHLERTSTLRSLSDSIISSYTKRGTAHLLEDDEPLPPMPMKHRRCDSARTERGGEGEAEAVVLSISKVSADMVKSPGVVQVMAVGN